MNAALRILLCTGEFPPSPLTGGIGTATRAAAAALADAGHDVHVLHCEVGSPNDDHDDPHGFTLHRRRLHRLANRTLGSSGLSQAIGFRRSSVGLGPFDVIEAPDWEAAVAGFVVGRRQPVVAAMYTPTAVVRDHGSTSGGAFRSWLEKWACRRADVAASSGPPLSHDLVRRGWFTDTAEIPVLPSCLEPELATCPSTALPDVPTVLAVGRLEHRKGFELLIRAVALLHDDARLVIVGRDVVGRQGRLESEVLTDLAGELGVRLRIFPPVPPSQLEPLYRAAWVVAVPSTFESFSMVGLEAAARGRAVVGSDRVGFVALAADGAGIRSVERSPAGFAAALGPLLSNRSVAATAGRSAQQSVQTQFSPAAFARARTELYISLLDAFHSGSTKATPSTSSST